MRRSATFLMIVIFGISIAGRAQTEADLSALEARLMAKLERRIAEESAVTNGQIGALRVAFREAVQGLAKSGNELDHKALVAIDKGPSKMASPCWRNARKRETWWQKLKRQQNQV